jgi:hypothetical protein
MCSTGGSPSAAASRPASVVFPEPDGPSMQTSRLAPHRGGAASTRAASEPIATCFATRAGYVPARGCQQSHFADA